MVEVSKRKTEKVYEVYISISVKTYTYTNNKIRATWFHVLICHASLNILKIETDEKVSIRFLKNQTWMQTKGQAAVIRSAPFYLPGLHCRGSFERLAVIPASNEWCRIGSCCLSMFELWLSKSCFTKVSAPVDSPFRVGVWRGGCSKIPFIKKGSLPPTTWWEMQQ